MSEDLNNLEKLLTNNQWLTGPIPALQDNEIYQ